MKVQCDVCSSEEASVFCCADEAALCGPCDRRVHSANKLAGKHDRLLLLHQSSTSSGVPPPPLCDVCQEKRVLMFCQEDRALLCSDCDVSIHNAYQLTAKHSRFLLTRVELSASPIPMEEAEIDQEKVSAQEEGISTSTNTSTSTSSSISDYLINTLPGWHVEDFLFDAVAAANSFAAPNSFCHQIDEALPFTESSYEFAEAGPLSESLDDEIFADGANDNKSRSGGKGSRKKKKKSEDVLTVPQFSE